MTRGWLWMLVALAGCSAPVTGLDSGVDGGTPDTFACAPSARDLPDPLGIDTDCDGLDGEEDHAIFVAAPADGGSDANVGNRSAPMATIGAALLRAAATPGTHVYVAVGSYAGSITLAPGVNVYGGF